MRRALERGEFVLHYQPLISLDDGRVTGIEALVRWLTPEQELVPPTQFIALAEETGLIIPLGEWILNAACTQMKAWRDSGIDLGILAVNLSPRQFRQTNLCNQLATILAETGLPAGCLELEITEGTLMTEGRDAETKLAAIKALGIRLAIDDFGTGYSSLAYLRRFPIDKLKVDRGFICDIPGDQAAKEIASAVIALGRTLNLEVLAEGVETEAQLVFLERQRCDTAQGFLFSRPLSATALEAWFALRSPLQLKRA
jgi:EAL domain-containing protein (putative c-di-GMP-specific phosphodiesterase class I)